MSLRFLTRRRDHDKSTSSPSQPSSKLGKGAAPSPARNDTPRKDKAILPPEIQIIGQKAAQREIHVRSRTDNVDEEASASQSAAPIYAAFTTPKARRTFTTSTSHDVEPSKTTTTPTTSSARPKTAPRIDRREWNDSPRTLFEPFSLPQFTLATPTSPTRTPRSEHIEELNTSSTALRSVEAEVAQEDARSRLPFRFGARARRAKARSHQSTTSYDAYSDTEGSSSSSRSPFYSIRRNASVQSFASFMSVSMGTKNESTTETIPSSSTSSSFLSKVPSTRRLRRRKPAPSADQGFDPASSSDVEPTMAPPTGSRSRSSSFSSMTPKFLQRGKDKEVAPSAPSQTVKSTPLAQLPAPQRRNGGGSVAPPSAWKSDLASSPHPHPTPDFAGSGAARGGGASSSFSCYSSDNESLSIGPGSSSGHHGYFRHSRKPSSSTGTDVAHTATAAPAAGVLATSSPYIGEMKRASSYSTRTPDQVAAGAPPGAFESPIISGQPLSLDGDTKSEPGAHFASQLFKRLGPLPVGFPAECFEERVLLICSYVESQVPPSPSTLPKGYSNRSSLPPPTRLTNTSYAHPASANIARLAALEDEFEKIERQAETALLSSSSPAAVELRLEAFKQARKRCGLDRRKSRFEMPSQPSQPQPVQSKIVVAEPEFEFEKYIAGASLKPAPRQKRGGRRPGTAPVLTLGQGMQLSPTPPAATRVGSAADASSPPLQSSRLGSSPSTFSGKLGLGEEGGLFTPESFRSPRLASAHSNHSRPNSTSAAGLVDTEPPTSSSSSNSGGVVPKLRGLGLVDEGTPMHAAPFGGFGRNSSSTGGDGGDGDDYAYATPLATGTGFEF